MLYKVNPKLANAAVLQGTAIQKERISNDKELADFTRSQEVYKQAEIDAINQADEEQKKTL